MARQAAPPTRLLLADLLLDPETRRLPPEPKSPGARNSSPQPPKEVMIEDRKS